MYRQSEKVTKAYISSEVLLSHTNIFSAYWYRGHGVHGGHPEQEGEEEGEVGGHLPLVQHGVRERIKGLSNEIFHLYIIS